MNFTKRKKAQQDLDEIDYAEVNKKWYEENHSKEPKSFGPVTDQILIELQDEAKKCYDSEVATYNIKTAKTNSSYKWTKTIMSKGTMSDKIAAYTVLIQDNPLYNLNTLQNLVNLIKVGKKKECTMAIDVLTQLFLSDLLRPDEKLKQFAQRPLSSLNELSSGNAVTRRKLLSVWHFEDYLKQLYHSFITSLNTVAHDSLDVNKEKAIGAMFNLLTNNPEQEKVLLQNLVNKLGDPSQKIASKVIYGLGQLLHKHPNMQGVVLLEMEKLLFRSNISQKTQYYGLCFLSQFYLTHGAREVARKLIELYFSFFKACIKKGEVDSRMMSALLMGVNRAYPYAKLELEKISDHIDTMYRVVHIANFNISLHALTLLYQVSDDKTNLPDRFYSALYKKLFDPKVLITTHQAMLLSLVHKAIFKDTEISRVKVFIKRLLQLTLFTQPAFGCGVMYLVSQLVNKKSGSNGLFLRKTKMDAVEDDDDDEEKYQDVDDTETKPEEDEKPDAATLASWDHCANLKDKGTKESLYNPLNRNPLYAGGDFCAYTELLYLKNHFHPTVAQYAENILEGTLIKYSGDPLKDFTLMRFLDRFVYKNPKKLEDNPGVHPTFGKRKLYVPRGIRRMPVNSISYVKEDFKNIPADEVFMYSYLKKKYQDQMQQKKDEDESDVESVQSEEFEDMLDKMAGLAKDDDVDYMGEIADSLQKKETKKKRKGDVDDDEEDSNSDLSQEDELDEEGDDDDIDMNEEDEEMLGDLDDDEDEELIFGDDDDDDDLKPSKGKAKKKDKNSESVFASAEEFATLLEDEGSSKYAPGKSSTFVNKDKASVKQIAWEEKRNMWMNNYNKKVGKPKSNTWKRKNNNKTGNFPKKRKNK